MRLLQPFAKYSIGGAFALLAFAVSLVAAPRVPAQKPPAAIAWLAIAQGELADVNAKEGDSAFDAVYFANANLTGKPAASRLEKTPGTGEKVPGLAGAFSARWTAIITPKHSGIFPIGLRSVGASVLKVDERTVLQRPAHARDIKWRAQGEIALEAGKPYQFVVELRSSETNGLIAVEWAKPKPGTAAAALSGMENLAGPAAGAAVGAAATLENKTYSLASQPDGSFLLTEKRGGARATFAPEFAVVWQPRGSETKMDSGGGKYQDPERGSVGYTVPSWNKQTDFLLAAHPRTRLRASSVTAESGRLKWSFPAQPGFTLTAEVSLPQGAGEPVIEARLKALAAAQFSLGYVGAPATTVKSAEWVWQPLIWQEKRFPNRSYLTKEFQCPIPWTMVGVSGAAIGVGADAREMPYRMPTMTDSRFGVLVRNAAGEMQPMVFAPVLGGPESALKAGDSYQFAFRVCARQGGWFDAYKGLARSLYQFADIRENGECSLNTTIENMMDYILNDRFVYWFPKFKTWGYQNDGGPGAGRQQSAADAIGLALVCDSAEFYRQRALPTLEYMLSRNSVSIVMDKPDYMNGPIKAKNFTDFTAAHHLTGGRNAVLGELLAHSGGVVDAGLAARLAKTTSISQLRSRMIDDLTQYRITGQKAFLEQACAAAARYIELRLDRPAEDFRDSGSSFWNELSPSWDVLYELYQETGDRKFLASAAKAMRQFTAYTYLVPVIPPGNFTANPGGLYNGQPVPEEVVPAWRVSANGLAAECGATSLSHRGVFMFPYGSYLARLGAEADEPFFTDIARNAIVGRYCNYPSYAYRNGYTTLHQKADYPLRPFEEIKKFTTAHYNHPLPMAAFLVDYLVSDMSARSGGQVDFPSEYTHTGAYFHNKLYGARPGKFYDESGVVPWLPKGLLQADSVQVNYLAGRGNGKLYLALANQSAQPITTTIVLNPDRVRLASNGRARMWMDNKVVAPALVTDGRVTVKLSPKGLTCLAIEGVTTKTEIQDAMLDPACPPLPPESSTKISTEFGDVTATALRFGKGLTTIHVWLKAGSSQVKSAKLTWTIAGQTKELVCPEFPFEFTVPVMDEAGSFSCEVEAAVVNGPSSRTGVIKLPL